jgi:gamma-glutamylcyclotransferase (GGCT)/AIG2-like uncharacterized protein YtfP
VTSARYPLFVFGTLRRGERNHHYLVGRFTRCEVAELPGYARIAELMIAPRAGSSVQGELFWLDPDRYDESLFHCDDLEEIPRGTLVGHEYQRALVTVLLDGGLQDGEPQKAWAYVQPEGLRRGQAPAAQPGQL